MRAPSPFSKYAYADLAGAIAREIALQPAEAAWAVARDSQVSVYRQSDVPVQEVPFTQVYDDAQSFAAAVRAASPQALEAALEVLSVLAPSAAERIAFDVLRRGLWRGLVERAYIALGRASSEQGFRRLLDVIGNDPAAGAALLHSHYERGAELALARLRASSIRRTRRLRLPTLSDYQAMSEAERQTLADTARAHAREDEAETAVVLPLLRYLGKRRYAEAQPLVVDLFRGHPSPNVRAGAGQALFDYGDPESFGALLAAAQSSDVVTRALGLRAVLRGDAALAYTRLGGEDLLHTSKAELVGEIFQVLCEEARELRGQFSEVLADPRWLALALHWRTDRRLRERAEALLLVLPRTRERSPRRTTKTKRKTRRSS